MIGPFVVPARWSSAAKGGALTLPATATSHSLLVNKAKMPQVKVAWNAASDAGSGVASHTVLYRSTANGSTWASATKQLGAAAKSWTLSGAAGQTYCFKVRHTDAVGNSRTTPERCASMPFDNAAFGTAGTWTAPTGKAYYLGSVARTKATGATLTRKNVKAKQIVLVATKCNGCGSVQVLLGGTQVGKTINLSTTSSTPLNRQVITVGALPSVKTGTLVVKVVSTGGKPVLIDGVGSSLR